MANNHSTLADLFSAIADAIREKTGGTAAIVADDFPNAIAGISAGLEIPSLEEAPWTMISGISQAGLAANCWSVGDRKSVTLNGTVGSRAFSNETYYVYIIGINHNSSIEGENRIHFKFGYSSLVDGKHLTFVDSGYETAKTSGSWFNMNNTASNSGGWEGSNMRNSICPAFKKVMPPGLQAVLKSVTKYSDNTGNGSDNAANVTATTEEVFLISSYEAGYTSKTPNSAEKNYQAQYPIYSNGNADRISYKHDATSDLGAWWTRSVSAKNATHFCCVGTMGGANSYGANYSYGFSPAFCV